MRRRRRIRAADFPRLLIGGVIGVAGLFSGRYARVEGANVYATDAEGRILVVRPTYSKEWMLPGGPVERGETPHEAAIRETREETGLDVVLDRLALIDARRARDTSFIFAGHVTGGELEPQLGEISEVGWLARDEIAATSRGLDRLLALTDGEFRYLGVP
jgi:ADP-ribose pyrophosphatase YjhB (NUDIX family)